MSKYIVFLLPGLLCAGPLNGQSADEEAPVREEQPVQAEEDLGLEDLSVADEVPVVDDAEEEALEPGDDPLAETEAGKQNEMKATMDRFEPSEEISEDRSVAFPNDI